MLLAFDAASFLRNHPKWWRPGPCGYRHKGRTITQAIGLQIIHARLLSVAFQTTTPDGTPVFTTYKGQEYRLTNDSIWPVPC